MTLHESNVLKRLWHLTKTTVQTPHQNKSSDTLLKRGLFAGASYGHQNTRAPLSAIAVGSFVHIVLDTLLILG